jgi:hypothetical protein
MHQTLPCGCVVDDEKYSTFHENDGYHYRLGLSPVTFCAKCDLFKPCACAGASDAVPKVTNRKEQ